MINKIIICVCAFVIGTTAAFINKSPRTCERVYIENAIPTKGAIFTYEIDESLPDKEKQELLEIAAEIIDSYKEDHDYNQGCTNEITPYLIMGLIQTESKGNQFAKGKAGEIGLTQIIPRYHEKALKSAGIIKERRDLWNKRENIEAGIYILMNNARTSQNIEHALSKYNTGKVCKKGLRYSKRVLAAVEGEK